MTMTNRANATIRVRNISVDDLNEILELINVAADGFATEIFYATPPVGTHGD